MSQTTEKVICCNFLKSCWLANALTSHQHHCTQVMSFTGDNSPGTESTSAQHMASDYELKR